MEQCIINMRRCPLFKLIGFVIINIAVCGSAKLLSEFQNWAGGGGLKILSNAATNDSEMMIINIV